MGFTLIELLVVIVILGILAAVVVFAVGGVGDKGKASAYSIEARTIHTSEEAYCARFGRYGSADELISAQFLSSLPVYNQVDTGPAASPGTGCTGAGDPSRAGYFVTCDASFPGCGGGGALKMAWRSQTSGTSALLERVHFMDHMNGWVVGDNQTILHTTTGGDGSGGWQSQLYTPTPGFEGENVVGIDIVDGDPPANARGWAVTDYGSILVTSNSGATWTPDPAYSPTWPLLDVDVVTPDNVWAVGWYGLIVHWDGSAWTTQRPADDGSDGDFIPAGFLHDVQFLDVNQGYAVGEPSDPGGAGPYDNVLVTANGGATWSVQGTPTPTGLTGVSFVTPQKGWAVGIGGPSNIFTTDDGGITWVPQLKTGDANGLDCVNTRQCWAALNLQPRLLSSGDGGRSWTKPILPSPDTGVMGIDFIDIAHGWAVRGGGAIVAFSASP
jgi:prepilin-type N-terminal cleavage/methylation domain-containing protein